MMENISPEAKVTAGEIFSLIGFYSGTNLGLRQSNSKRFKKEVLTIKRAGYILIYVLLVALTLAGCTFFGKDNTVVFIGTVLENNDTSLLVEPQAGSDELNSADKISVSINGTTIVDTENRDITVEQIRVGDRIEITYNGQIARKLPCSDP